MTRIKDFLESHLGAFFVIMGILGLVLGIIYGDLAMKGKVPMLK